MRVVVTGALGHIGSRLVRELPVAFPGCEVLLVDNLATQRYCSLFGLPQGRYEFVEADILAADLCRLFSGADVVVHLAAIAGEDAGRGGASAFERTNVEGTGRVAQACVATGAALLFVSTTSIYGSADRRIDDGYPRAGMVPESPYARTKFDAEGLLNSLGESGGLRFLTCRFGTVFGVSPGMRFHTAIGRFCWQAATGRPVTVWRTALRQRRPYLDVVDAAGAVVFLLRRGVFDSSAFNVVTANATVGDVLEAIARGRPGARIEEVDSPLMNDLSYDVVGDGLAGLGFECSGSLERGITETLALLGGLSGTTVPAAGSGP